jgi:hypothetical protein
MKDELDGLTIKEGYFFGIKQYGYWYIDKENKIEKSVFAGIKRDSLTFNEIKNIFNGNIIIKDIPIKFYKSLEILNIKIKSSTTTILFNTDKILVNNFTLFEFIKLILIGIYIKYIIYLINIIKYILINIIKRGKLIKFS